MIRIAEENDFDILNTYYRELSIKGDNPFTKTFVYEIEKRVIGFISYSIIYNRAEIEYIYIDEAYRKQNLASELVNFCIEDACSNRCENITLEVNANNEAGIKLYEKFGFKQVSIRPRYYSGEDGILMIREMSNNE